MCTSAIYVCTPAVCPLYMCATACVLVLYICELVLYVCASAICQQRGVYVCALYMCATAMCRYMQDIPAKGLEW